MKGIPLHAFSLKPTEDGHLVLFATPNTDIEVRYAGNESYTRKDFEWRLFPEKSPITVTIEGKFMFQLSLPSLLDDTPAQKALCEETFMVFEYDSLVGSSSVKTACEAKVLFDGNPVYGKFEKLGSGGQGQVHRALDATSGKEYAAKTLKEGLPMTKKAGEVFALEAELLRQYGNHVSTHKSLFP